MKYSDADYITKVLGAMRERELYEQDNSYRKAWKVDDWEEELDYSEKIREIERRPSEYKRMLMGVMKHLRETGADTLEVLRDNELNEWWGGEVAKIEAAERKAAAKERAMSVLSPEERRALGLKF